MERIASSRATFRTRLHGLLQNIVLIPVVYRLHLLVVLFSFLLTVVFIIFRFFCQVRVFVAWQTYTRNPKNEDGAKNAYIRGPRLR